MMDWENIFTTTKALISLVLLLMGALGFSINSWWDADNDAHYTREQMQVVVDTVEEYWKARCK